MTSTDYPLTSIGTLPSRTSPFCRARSEKAARGPAEAAAAEGALTGALRSLFAVVENYPDLKANENVSALQGQLATTENQIGGARDAYNAVVRDYNTAIATFPAALMAGPMGFTSRQFFEAEAKAQGVPTAQLR